MEVGGRKSEVRSRIVKLANFIGQNQISRRIFTDLFIILGIILILHYEFHNSLFTGVANFIIAEVPAL